MVLNFLSERTRTGDARLPVKLSPNCPCESSPQQYAVPSATSPHECACPAETDLNTRLKVLKTFCGFFCASKLPMPSCPSSFCPQHQISPLAVSPQLWPAPASMSM